MRIAIDCRLFNIPQAEQIFGVVPFIHSLLSKCEDHQYFLIFDQTPAASWCDLPQATTLVLKPAARSAPTRVLWYDLRLPALLSSHQIELFLGTAGFISLRTPVRQVLFLQDVLCSDSYPAGSGWQGSWYKRRLPAMVEKAHRTYISLNADLADKRISEKASGYSLLPLCSCCKNDFSYSEAEKQGVKETLTGGAEFFYCEAGWNHTDDAIELLLAFSAFKKRMLSGMKLVLAGTEPKDKNWGERMASYRYRNDVVLLPGPIPATEKNRILSAAYALLHLSAEPGIRTLQFALCAGVPAITRPHKVFMEMCGQAVLYCTDQPGENLAQNLMRIYKDEALRNVCVTAGRQIAANWDPENTIRTFYHTVFDAKG